MEKGIRLADMQNEYKRLLLISRGPWRNDRNSGSTYTTLFKNWPSNKISHLYMRPDLPSNQVCDNYFHITDKQIIESVFRRKPAGNRVSKQSGMIKTTIAEEQENKDGITKLYQFFKYRLSTVGEICREFFWWIGRVDYKKLDRWVEEHSPEIVHLSCTSSLYVYRMANHIIQKYNLPFVMYASDDVYAYHGFNFSPLFWAHRLMVRHRMRENIRAAKAVFVISLPQKEIYENLFGRQMHIITKNITGCKIKSHLQQSDIINFVYMGNIGSGRWKVLEKIAKEIEKINQNTQKCQLKIYSNLSLPSKIRKKLTLPGTSEILPAVAGEQVQYILSENDVLLHVESFKSSDKSMTRLSFSAKLVEYFEAGKCILAVGPMENASIQYLQKNDAAIVITDLTSKKLFEVFERILSNSEEIDSYARKAHDCGKRNHAQGSSEKVYLTYINK